MKRLWFALWLVAVVVPAAFAADPPAAPAGVRTLYLIRHGFYDFRDSTDDRVGRHLDSLGHAQARLVGARLAALPVKMSSLVSSELTRARETADDMAGPLGLTPARDSLLNECTPWANRPDIRYETPDEPDSAVARLERAWARYVRPAGAADEHDVLVCHGNVIRWFVCRALGADTRQWGSMDIGNGSITAILVRPDGATRLAIFSDVGHLPLETQTWAGRGPGWSGKRAPPRR
jgi:serine/threonine-protein phosphatase PGAM5